LSVRSNESDEAEKNRPPKNRLDFLDGLRGAAAFYVVIHHWWVAKDIYRVSHKASLLGGGLEYGHLSVDIFIVLSGFCLLLPVLSRNNLTLNVKEFFIRRARRILPPFIAAFLLSVAFAAVMHRFAETSHVETARTIATNLFLLQDLFPQRNIINGPLWSVAVEWKIYFIFPLLVYFLRKYGGSALVIAGAILTIAFTLLEIKYVAPLDNLVLSSPWYIYLFTVGIASAFVSVRRADARRFKWGLGITFLLSFAATIVLMRLFAIRNGHREVFEQQLSLIDPIVGIAVASLLGLMKIDFRFVRGLTSFFSLKPLTSLGKISYSVYLIHIPILEISRNMVNLIVKDDSSPFSYGLMGLLGVSLSWIVGYFFHLAVEKPFMNWKIGRPLQWFWFGRPHSSH
jgi:peptidoglycan/LPS O-acetylase OafA/YrhL